MIKLRLSQALGPLNPDFVGRGLVAQASLPARNACRPAFRLVEPPFQAARKRLKKAVESKTTESRRVRLKPSEGCSR
jgi:hypothetical protein